MIERAGIEAKLGFKAHPHMLRHACGFALANKGHDTRAWKLTLAIGISSIRFAIPNCHRRGSGISGGSRSKFTVEAIVQFYRCRSSRQLLPVQKGLMLKDGFRKAVPRCWVAGRPSAEPV